MRPVTIDDGLARRVRLSPASLVCVFKSSKVSCGLFRRGRIDRDFSNSFPISLNRPGFSSRAGGEDDGEGSPRGSAGGSGAACWAGVWMPSEGGGAAACGHAAPAAISDINRAADAAAAHVLDGAIRLPDRSSMVFSVTRSHRPAKPHLQQPECDVESKHQYCSPDTNPQAEPFFQLGADDVAIAVEQDRDHEEAA